ncbi:MAG: hypothetical protein MJE77_15795 [Proteobacteria bacterium]|nr:hypothetical protein [Pseudomonadota bacterium]
MADVVEVSLEHSRWRHFTWALASIIIGSALIAKLGAIFKLAGVVLLVLSARSTFLFIRTLVKAAGTIRIDRKTVQLPQGLCRGTSHSFATSEVRYVYFLRRAVPWTQAAPLLVIEVGDQVFTYSRDWFVSEADQRGVAQILHKHLAKNEANADLDKKATSSGDDKKPPGSPAPGNHRAHSKTAAASEQKASQNEAAE